MMSLDPKLQNLKLLPTIGGKATTSFTSQSVMPFSPFSPFPLANTTPGAPPVCTAHPMEINFPLATANKHIDDFLQTLQSPTQRVTFKRDTESFLTTFVKSYGEQKSIDKAKDDDAYCPMNSKVKVPFQPIEWVLKSAAYLALVAEATDITTRMSKEVGALYLQCRILNLKTERPSSSSSL